MTPEELLKPRYKVIAHYPNSCFAVDDVYTKKEIDFGIGSLPENYPAIFKKLRWWEERAIKDLPLYVRFGDFDKQHKIYKVASWGQLGEDFKHMEPCGYAENEYFISLQFPNNFPSTEQEYLSNQK